MHEQLKIAGVVVLIGVLSACDITRGVRRTVPGTAVLSDDAVANALSTVPVDSMERATTGGVTHFVLRRGKGFGVVQLDPEGKANERVVLYSIALNQIPPPEVLAANRALLDEAYEAMRKVIPGLPRPNEVEEAELGLPKP